MNHLCNVHPIVYSLSDMLTEFLLVFVSLLVCLMLWKKQPTQCGYPSGPFSFPILGNLPQMILCGSRDAFLKYYRDMYGDVYTVEFGGNKRVVLSGYDNMHSVVVKHADICSERSTASMPIHLKDFNDKQPGLLWAPFPHWKALRTFTLKVLKEEGMGKASMEPKVLDEINRYCSFYIEPNLNKPMKLFTLQKASNNVISEMIFGGRSDYNDKKLDQYLESMDRVVRISVRVGMIKNIPLIRYLSISGMKEVRHHNDLCMPEMLGRLQEHRANLDKENPKDIFDEFLIHQQQQSQDSSCFSDGNAAMLANQMYAGGTETVATSLEWALLYMCLKPQIKNRVQSEIDNAIGQERSVCYIDRHKLPYTEAVLLETLRHANILPTALPRTVEQSLRIADKIIPAGADLMFHMASVLHDEKVFENSKEFNPDRYLTGDIKRKKQQTIPFFIGRRDCIGKRLAKVEIFLFFVTFMQRYDVRLPADQEKTITTTPTPGLFNKPMHYDIIFVERQPKLML